MKLSEYVVHVRRTNNLEGAERAKRDSWGIFGEVGEVIDTLKKHVYHGKALNVDQLLLELGDTMWYVVDLIDAKGIDPDLVGDVAEKMNAILTSPTIFHAASDHDLIFTNLARCVAGLFGQASPILGDIELFPFVHLVGAVDLIARKHGLSLDRVLEANVAKLRKRYPDGFTTEAANAPRDAA